MRKLELYDHNKIAYEKVETMLAEEGRVAVIHPTGTGKSFIAFALVEAHPDRRFLWLVVACAKCVHLRPPDRKTLQGAGDTLYQHYVPHLRMADAE